MGKLEDQTDGDKDSVISIILVRCDGLAILGFKRDGAVSVDDRRYAWSIAPPQKKLAPVLVADFKSNPCLSLKNNIKSSTLKRNRYTDMSYVLKPLCYRLDYIGVSKLVDRPICIFKS